MTALDGGCRTFLALEPELIDILPRDAFERCDRIRADTLMRLRVPGTQAKIAGVHHERPLAATAFHRHHLGAAGDHQILGTRHDRVCGHVNGGNTGTAEAIQRDAAGADVVAGVKRRHPSEIAALRTALGTGAPDDVVDLSGIDAGAVRQRAQYGGAELLRMNARQRALAGLADAARCPAGVDDQRVSHGVFLGFVDLSHLRPIAAQCQFASTGGAHRGPTPRGCEPRLPQPRHS